MYSSGDTFVDLFFLISGFIFSHVYGNKIIQKSISFKNFIILRLSRLYPLHLITLVVVTILQIIRYNLTNSFFVYLYQDVFHFILNLAFLQYGFFNTGFSFNGPSWSISMEMLAYGIFFGVLFKYGANKYFKYIFTATALLGIWIMQGKISFISIEIGRVLLGFFLGVTLYDAYLYLKNLKSKKLIITLLLVTLSILIYLIYTSKNTFIGQQNLTYTLSLYPIIILLSLLFKPFSLLLSTKPFKFLGDISYSVYMWHFPIQLGIDTINNAKILPKIIDYNSNKFIALYIFLVISVSTISYYFIEAKLQKLARQKFVKV